MKVAVIVGWVARALVIILALVNSRLLIDIVGVEGLAVQSILVSLTMWIGLLNLGIPPTVQNLISRCRAEGTSYEIVKQTSLSLILILFIVFVPVVIFIGIIIKRIVLVGYANVATMSTVSFCIALLILGLSSLFNQILYSEQRGYWPNLYPAINALCVTICLSTFQLLSINNINSVLLVFAFANILVSFIGGVQVKFLHIWVLDRKVLLDIYRDCRGFALFAFLGTGVCGIDYLIMSRLLSAQEISTYNICQRVYMALLSVHGVILTSAWPAISEALFAKQWKLSRQRVSKLLIIGEGIAIVVGSVIMTYINFIADTISHHKIASISPALVFLFFMYIMVRAWSDTFATTLLSCNKTTILNNYLPFQAFISVLAQVTLGNLYGANGIILGIILSFLFTSVWILPRAFYKITEHEIV